MKRYILCDILFPKRKAVYRVTTLLLGRYVEINLLPLSFAEYVEVKGKSDGTAFADYMRWGSSVIETSVKRKRGIRI